MIVQEWEIMLQLSFDPEQKKGAIEAPLKMLGKEIQYYYQIKEQVFTFASFVIQSKHTQTIASKLIPHWFVLLFVKPILIYLKQLSGHFFC